MKNIGGWRLLRFHGVDLRLHISLIILLVYVVFVASMQLPYVANQAGIDPILLSASPWVWGIIFAVSLLFSVVIHEFGHVLVAQSMGVKVKGITLMMLGGVSEMENIPEKPFAEFKIAVIGPIVSLSFAAFLFFVERNVESLNLQFYSYWIGRLNLVLGIFNLLPAFPLDGGRIFRSLLATRYGLARATYLAVRTAKGLAWVLGILGFMSFNFLLILIAFFIHAAASSELKMAASKVLLKGVLAKDVGIRTNIIKSSSTLDEVASNMINSRDSTLPVISESGEVGLVSLDSLKKIPRDEWSEKKVSEIINPVTKVVNSSDQLDEIFSDIVSNDVLPFADNGEVVGVIRYSELVEFLEFKSLGKVTNKNAA